MTIDPKQAHLWIVGGGIAGMATAAFAIRDAGVPGENIHILEELGVVGGAMDGARSPVVAGALVTRGARKFCGEVYQSTWDLFSTIPSLEDPDITVRQEVLDFHEKFAIHGNARLVDAQHSILNAADYGLNTRDRIEMARVLALSEEALGARRIEDMFSEHFLATNFWQMWRTTFAFQKWHSAAEARRYFRRFVQEFGRLDTHAGVVRTKYNQYDSMIVPLQRWLAGQGSRSASPPGSPMSTSPDHMSRDAPPACMSRTKTAPRPSNSGGMTSPSSPSGPSPPTPPTGATTPCHL